MKTSNNYHRKVPIENNSDLSTKSNFNCNLNTNLLKSKNKIRVHYLSDLEKHYEDKLKCTYSKSTFSIYKGLFKNLINNLGDLPLKSYQIADFEKYKKNRYATLNETSVNIEIRHLKALFNEAKRMNMIEVNPVSNIKKFRINEKSRLSFNGEHINYIISNCLNIDLKEIILFAYYTGCRINEILNIQLEDINYVERIITINNKDDFKTKTGAIRNVYINKELEEIITKRINVLTECDSGNDSNSLVNKKIYLFNNKNRKYRKDSISKSFKRILRKLKFDERYNFHCLRHTFATILLKEGVNVYELKTLLGHTSIQTTVKYLHTDDKALRIAVNKLSGFGGHYA